MQIFLITGVDVIARKKIKLDQFRFFQLANDARKLCQTTKVMDGDNFFIFVRKECFKTFFDCLLTKKIA